MNPKHKRAGTSSGFIKKVAKSAGKKSESALVSVADRLHVGSRVKHAKAILKRSPSRAKRLLKSTPVKVLASAAAVAFVVAKVKQHLG